MDWTEFVDRLRFLERKVSPLRITLAESAALTLPRSLELMCGGFRVQPGPDIAYLSDGSRVDLRSV